MAERPLPSADEIHARLRERLGDAATEPELSHKAWLAHEIHRLKRERNAVILGHNYMEPALFHSIPDFVGDSLELSRQAARTDRDVIVFCGVRFMAETAKILNPGKTVLLPSLEAGCSLAASITAADVRRAFDRRATIDDITVITPADLEITKDGSDFVIAFAYQKKVPLFANVSVLIDFAGTSKPGSTKLLE